MSISVKVNCDPASWPAWPKMSVKYCTISAGTAVPSSPYHILRRYKRQNSWSALATPRNKDCIRKSQRHTYEYTDGICSCQSYSLLAFVRSEAAGRSLRYIPKHSKVKKAKPKMLGLIYNTSALERKMEQGQTSCRCRKNFPENKGIHIHIIFYVGESAIRSTV